MEQDWTPRLRELVEALCQRGIPATADPENDDPNAVVFAAVPLRDGTFLLIAEDDEWFMWGRCDGDTGQFTDEDNECDLIPNDADLARVAAGFAELLDARGWTPAQPQPPAAGDPEPSPVAAEPVIPERVEEAGW
jgi:hypothetical protein